MKSAWLVAIVCALQSASERVEFDAKELARIEKLSPLSPPAADPTNRVADDALAAWLGQSLFFDPRLSRNQQIACSTCHDPKLAFADGKQIAEGLEKADRHAPSLLNVAQNRWFFWDGRADSLWSQALGPIENDKEMGSSRLRVARVVFGDAKLRAAYERLFGALAEPPKSAALDAKPSTTNAQADASWRALDETTRDALDRAFANVGKALEAYERRLVTGPSPFDRFVDALRTKDAAKIAEYPLEAQRGLQLFIGKANCRSCHSGPNFSDGEFHSTGVPPLGGGSPHDSGRHAGGKLVLESPFNAASKFSDAPKGEAAERLSVLRVGPDNWGEFKTPSLRNVASRAPYMHQGQLASLAKIVRFYSTMEGSIPAGHHQETVLQPLNLSDREQSDLVIFLQTLTGEPVPAELCAPPTSPPPHASSLK